MRLRCSEVGASGSRSGFLIVWDLGSGSMTFGLEGLRLDDFIAGGSGDLTELLSCFFLDIFFSWRLVGVGTKLCLEFSVVLLGSGSIDFLVGLVGRTLGLASRAGFWRYEYLKL